MNFLQSSSSFVLVPRPRLLQFFFSCTAKIEGGEGFEDEHEGRGRGRWGVILLLVLGMLFGSAAKAQEPQAFARSSIGTTGDIWTGQKVTWVVELIVPGFFSGTPAYDLPDMPGLLILPPEGSPTVGSEQNGGIDGTVQRYEFSVFAQRAGTFRIPPMAVRLAFKKNPLDANPAARTVEVPEVSFAVNLPPGAEKLGMVLSARDLKVEENWHPQPGRAKTGDTFTRTITYEASDIPGMAFPPFPAPEIEGLGVYRKTPEVLDQADRGELRGRRRETITYVCEKPGRYTIPASQMTWWNIGDRKLETIEFPKQSIQVAGTALRTRSGRSFGWILGAGLGLVALIGAGFIFRRLSLRLYWHRALRPWAAVHLSPLNPGSD